MGELRMVVQDLANTSDSQGNKIKKLESTLDAAREAKNEVHRLKSDLDAETSARTLKDTELQGRVERVTAATSELGGDLQKSRSNVMHHSMRTGSVSVTSLGSASFNQDRARLSQGHSRGGAAGFHNVDS